MTVNPVAVKQPEDNFVQRATNRIHQGNDWKWADLKGNFGKRTKESLIARVNAFALALINSVVAVGVATLWLPVATALAVTVKVPTYFANKFVRLFSQDSSLAKATAKIDGVVPSLFTSMNLVKFVFQATFSAASHLTFGVVLSPTINEEIQSDLDIAKRFESAKKADKARTPDTKKKTTAPEVEGKTADKAAKEVEEKTAPGAPKEETEASEESKPAVSGTAKKVAPPTGTEKKEEVKSAPFGTGSVKV